MQSPDQMKREIAEIEDRLQKIASQISTKEKELQKQTKHHQEVLLRHLDKKIKPRCIETAHRLAMRLESELNSLRQATEQMVVKLDEARARLALAELYDGPVKQYHKEKSSFSAQAESIRISLNQLNEQIRACKTGIDSFLDGAGTPLDLLKIISESPLMAGLSLEVFIGGRIAGGAPHENGAFLQRVASDFRNLADKMPKPEDLEESWTALSYQLHVLSQQASSLIPRDMKYNSPAPAQVRREVESTMRIPAKPPERLLTEGQRKAKEALKASALHR